MRESYEPIGAPVFRMPGQSKFASGKAPGGNRLYVDLRGRFTWSDAQVTLEHDRKLVAHIERVNRPREIYDFTIDVLARVNGVTQQRYEDDHFDMKSPMIVALDSIGPFLHFATLLCERSPGSD